MTTKNTTTKKTTTTKAKATGTKPAAVPKDKTSEKELPASKRLITTPFNEFTKEDVAEFIRRNNKIRMSMNGIDASMETIAFCLYWAYAKEAYHSMSFMTFVDYAKKMFGYSKTSAYAFLGVVERFASRDDDGSILEEIDPRYMNYGFSKLSLLVGLTDAEIMAAEIDGKLSPSMSVRDIRKFVASLNGKKADVRIDFNTLDKAISLSKKEDGTGEETGDAYSGDNRDKAIDTESGEDNAVDNSGTAVDAPSGDSPDQYMFTQCLFTVNSFDDYYNKVNQIYDTVLRLYKEMPDVSVKVIVERNNRPLAGKWGE